MNNFGRRREDNTSFSFTRFAETEDVFAASYIDELNKMIVKFGRSLLNVAPADIPRLNAAVENDDSDEIFRIIGTANVNADATNNQTELVIGKAILGSFFKMAVKDCKTEWVECFLCLIAQKSIHFDIGASMMKESFNDLWLDYSGCVAAMISNDVLSWDVCTIEVPVETFSVQSNLGTRVGTCNTITDWVHASRQGEAFEHWSSLDVKRVDKLMKKSRRRKVNAIVRIFCFKDACQFGLDGIVRYLLMHNAPPYLFKSPLLKWVITFKWERGLKNKAFLFYALHILCSTAPFFAVAVLPLFNNTNLSADNHALYVAEEGNFTAKVIILALLLAWSLTLEYLQLRRYIWDGRRILPSNCFRGFTFYFSSFGNQIVFMLNGLKIFILIRTIRFHCFTNTDSHATPFSLAPAIVVLLLWAQLLYCGFALVRKGICGAMIARVLKECMPYFFLLLQITMAFGSALTVALVEYWLPKQDKRNANHASESSMEQNDEEEESELESTLGDQYRSTLNMAYAIVGLFDPEVLFEFGSMHWFIIVLFLLYLLIQSILMFNILIASMGDAYDGVKAAEEELFLMGRAKLIDRNEARLTNKTLQEKKAKIGKYLYVLMPEDKQLEENVPFWKGRIPTIKEDVRKIVEDSQKEISQNTSEMFKALMDEIKSLQQQVTTLEQHITEQDGGHLT